MDAKTKTALHALFFESKAEKAWSSARLKSYLRELKNEKGGSDIHISYTKREEIKNSLLKWVEAYDPKLEVFNKYQREYEKFRHKAVGLYNIPKELAEKKAEIQKKYSSQDYEFGGGMGEDFAVVGVDTTDDVTEVLYARKSARFTTITLKESDVDKKTWTELSKVATPHGTLQQILLKVEMGFRTVSTVTIDFKNNHLYVSTDSGNYFDDDHQGKDLADQRIIDAIGTFIEPITKSGTERLQKQIVESEVIFPDVEEKLHSIDEADLLFIPYRFSFAYNTTITGSEEYNLAEDVRNSISSFSFNDAFRSVKEYYTEHGDLKNFLTERKQWDAEAAATILNKIKSVKEAKQTGFAYFVFYTENEHVEGFKISFEPANKRIRFEGKDIKEKHYDIVMGKVREFLS